MAHRFKIWNQGNDGNTMGIRADGMEELKQLAGSCTQPDIAGNYSSLSALLE